MRTVWLAGLVLACAAPRLAAQESMCDRPPGGNPELRQLLAGGRFPAGFEPMAFRSGIEGDAAWFWASSYLGPPRNTPADLADFARRCRYNPERALDEDSTTGWCEGVPGDGIGEMLYLPAPYFAQRLDTAYGSSRLIGLLVWGGLGRSAALHRANARPRTLRVLVVRKAAAGTDSIDVRVAASHEVELVDHNGWQHVPLPEVRFDSTFSFLALEIRSVFPGTRFHDACIAGIVPLTRPVDER